ncbi:MAG: RtcB family protein [Candidatus Cloacimonetes bacterium]|nr:RtcB family protein [Candidatus Cloacimonadota bacterium]
MKYKDLIQISSHVWELPATGEMLVPGRIYANDKLISQVYRDNALAQVSNVAKLPGIQKYSIAMPDIHWGYGFPIGGVAAMEVESGIISPGGVGYDINCGVRFIRTNLELADIREKLPHIIDVLFRQVPAGVGSSNSIPALNYTELKEVLKEGAKWAVRKGYGKDEDLDSIEEYGCLNAADPEKVSNKALKRGADQPGTLGSGNHFIEIGVIRDIFQQEAAQDLHLHKDQVIFMIHTGSRGLGHQICDDYVHEMLMQSHKLKFRLPDKQLACAYINSTLGRNYFGAMACAANFAWANRQIIMHKVEEGMLKALDLQPDELGFELVYDVCHNIAKFEEHKIDNQNKLVCVHRKGATRAFGPGRKELAAKFHFLGQPVIIPGDMGTESYLCLGTDRAMQDTFGSSCHGAGRTMSRHQALNTASYNQVMNDMKAKQICVKAADKKTLVEEMSSAYKNVSDVVDTMHEAGIIRKIIRSQPLGVIKG